MTTSKRRSAPPRAKGFLDALEDASIEALRTAEGTVEPVALLWTDADRQWVGLIARLPTSAAAGVHARSVQADGAHGAGGVAALRRRSRTARSSRP